MAKTIKEKTPAQIAAAEKKSKAAGTKKATTPAEETKSNNQDTPKQALTYAEAEKVMNNGGLVKLPEWKGFWFKSLKEDKVYVFTKDGEILDTPHEEHKERNDWQEAGDLSPDVTKKLDDFHASFEIPVAKPETKETKSSVKKLAFEKAYALLKSGKSVQVAGKPGYLKISEGITQQFADNGDYLGNVNLADLQEEKEWEEK